MAEAARNAVVVIFGLAGGLAVGSGAVALLVALDLIPRLAQLSRTYHMSRPYEIAIVSGSVYWTLSDFLDIRLPLEFTSTAVFGLFAGIFVGMLAAALTEVLNVFPILAKRLHMAEALPWLLMAMVFGKVIGSLFEWIVYSDISMHR